MSEEHEVVVALHPEQKLIKQFWTNQRARSGTPIVVNIRVNPRRGLQRLLNYSNEFLETAGLLAVTNEDTLALAESGVFPASFSADLYFAHESGDRIIASYKARGPFECYDRALALIRPQYHIAADGCLVTEPFGEPYGISELSRASSEVHLPYATLIGDVHRAWIEK